MAHEKLTIIMAYRDRDLKRLARSLNSLTTQTRRDFKLYFVDYGSKNRNAQSAQRLLQQFHFCRYIYSHTCGWVWNKPRALNIGIKLADTDYILSTDIDIIFSPNFVETLLATQDGASTIYCAPIWLPKHFKDWEHVTEYASKYPKKRRALGTCQCYPRSAIETIKGFDEQLEYYGLEDNDLGIRLRRLGLRDIWIDTQTAIFHQWHESSGLPLSSRSYYARINSPYVKQMSDQPVRNTSDYGEITCRNNRPLLDLLPELEEKRNVAWTTLLSRLAAVAATSNLGPKWLIKDRTVNSEMTPALKSQYQCAVIHTSWKNYFLQSAARIEHHVENLMARALTDLKKTCASSPGVIVIDVPVFFRISCNLFRKILGMLAPGGYLVIANLGKPDLPIVQRLTGKILTPFLIRIAWYLRRRISHKTRQHCYQMITFFDNNLYDSLAMARIGTTEILDYTTDFSLKGATAVFMKSNRVLHV